MESTDQEAVVATLKNRHAFSVLVNKYSYPLTRYIQRLGNLDADVAKDILQETFIKAYVNLNDYNQALPFSSWLYRIAHNETMMHFRRQKNRPRIVQTENEILFELIPDELDIVAETDAKLRGARMSEAMGKLKQEYRDILVLRFFEEKSYEEISDILEIPEGTVATHLARGKKALEVLLREQHITDIHYGKDE